MSIRQPAAPHHLDTVPRAATAAAVATLAALLAACGPDTGDERTVASDRTADRPEARRELPPPTPEYRPDSVRAQTPPANADEGGPAATAADTLDGEVTYARAEAAYRAGDHRRAVRLLEAHLERRPSHTWARYLLGLAGRKADRPDRAERAFRSVLEVDPDHVKTRVNLARTLLDRDRPEEALTTLRPVLRGPDPTADALRVAGNAVWSAGDRERARRLYRAAVSTDGGDAWSMNNLGLLLIREGSYRRALGPLARAAELRPDRPEIRNNLAAALERTEHWRLAAEHYRAAAEAGHGRAEVSLARVEPRAGDEGGGGPDLAALAHDFAVEAESWSGALALEPSGPDPAVTDSTDSTDPTSEGPAPRF